MRTLLTGLALSLTLSSGLSAQEWDVDTSASQLTFGVTAFEEPLSGHFDQFDAEIRLDPRTAGTPSGRHPARPAACRTWRARRLWRLDTDSGAGLAVDKHPEARFVSREIVREGDDYRASGDLTLKGVTIPVTLPFTLSITDGRAVADGQFKLDRQRFNVGEDWDDIEDMVTIHLHIEADAVGSF